MACGHKGPPKGVRYILDDGTSGWVKIKYNQPDAPELPVQDGFAVVRISQGMNISTSSPMTAAWDKSEFYYQSPEGKRVRLATVGDDQRRLWGMEKTSDTLGDRETFFVGKPDEFTHVYKAAGDMGTGLLRPETTKKDADQPDIPNDRMRIETELPKK